jgi:hypothetical protein
MHCGGIRYFHLLFVVFIIRRVLLNQMIERLSLVVLLQNPIDLAIELLGRRIGSV